MDGVIWGSHMSDDTFIRDYLITFGVLFVGYLFVRWIYSYYDHDFPRKDVIRLPVMFSNARMELTGKSIDAENLAAQVKELRAELREHRDASAHSPDFKRALRVEEKRQQIAKLAFFEPRAEQPHDGPSQDQLLMLMA
jgi:hypothetical protein